MALIDSIDKFTNKDRGDGCNVPVVLAKLNAEDKKALLDAIAKGVPTSTLTSALRAEGYKLGDATLNKHRKGECVCPK